MFSSHQRERNSICCLPLPVAVLKLFNVRNTSIAGPREGLRGDGKKLKGK